MRFQSPLAPARLIRRYKRFLADVVLDDGSETTVHVANPGAMTGLAEPGMRVWLEDSGNPKRKLPVSWRLVEPASGGLACVDTSLANRVIGAALGANRLGRLDAAGGVEAEVRYGANSRADFRIRDRQGRATWVEVKSVTLSRARGLAEFPDAVTTRGARHMAELAARVDAGDGAAVVYLVQRTDATGFRVADDIDPAYADAFRAARAAGVAAMAVQAEITFDGITAGRPLPIRD